MNKKILFLVPDSVGIRNYLYSDLLKYLILHGIEIHVWSPLKKEFFNEVEFYHKFKINYKNIPLKSENYVVTFLREILTYARLKFNSRIQNNSYILKSNWTKNIKKKKYGWFLLTIIEALGLIVSKNYSFILFITNLINRLSYKKD